LIKKGKDKISYVWMKSRYRGINQKSYLLEFKLKLDWEYLIKIFKFII